MARNIIGVLGGFADLWMFGERESTDRRTFARDYRPRVVARAACPKCGASKGESCVRETAHGRLVRQLPHLERATVAADERSACRE